MVADVNSPNWANRTVWTGDNLHVMRGMNSNSVDLIYLDPPFNSNRDYEAPIDSAAAGAAFKDAWTLSDVDLAWHGEIAERQPAVYAIIDSAGIAHGKGMKSYLIMMAVRLLEMARILKPTGSLWLHCDPTAAHYLKMLLDAVLGVSNYRNEVTWRRTNAHPLSIRRFEQITDTLLYYAASSEFTFHGARTPMTEEQVNALYSQRDERGRFASTDLSGGKRGGADAYKPFKDVLPPSGRAWAPPELSKFPQWAQDVLGDAYSDLSPLDKCHALDTAGMIHWTKTGRPRLKRYIEGEPTQLVPSLWSDINPAKRSERTGYPTEKPLPLLERIIASCTDRGDIVFDPFCGCATTLVAADRLQRQWAGIDLSPVAAKLVLKRIRDDQGPMFNDVTSLEQQPRRTDLGKLPNYTTRKHTLYGQQEGKCNGCRVLFPYRNFTVDHIIARERGGTDHYDNLQLLCGACNSTKGTGTHEQLIVKLEQQGIIQRIGT